jgi:hypothetical protein
MKLIRSLFVVSLLASTSALLPAQQTPGNTPPADPNPTQTDLNAPTPSTQEAMQQVHGSYAPQQILTGPPRPVAALSAGFTYLQTDLTGTPGANAGYLMGWYVIPQYNFSTHVGLIADFTNFYNWHAHAAENVHGFTGGPVYMMPLGALTPFTFLEGGAVRDSRQGTITWSPAIVAGVGANLKITKLVSFQLVPGEYVTTKLPNGNWESNYNAKAGFVIACTR